MTATIEIEVGQVWQDKELNFWHVEYVNDITGTVGVGRAHLRDAGKFMLIEGDKVWTVESFSGLKLISLRS